MNHMAVKCFEFFSHPSMLAMMMNSNWRILLNSMGCSVILVYGICKRMVTVGGVLYG